MGEKNDKKTATQIFRFRQFPVYEEIRKFRKELKQLSRNKFPDDEKFALRSQLWRALDSMLLNVAEGSGRYSDVDFSRFLNLSLTSLNEVIACLDGALDDEYITLEEHKHFLEWGERIFRQLTAFSAKVRKDNKKN